jgi:MFS family permease|tara:strand:+ start:614 stop:1813 length:1200 start_codon:yes stop_codon:yes gene_type:complete
LTSKKIYLVAISTWFAAFGMQSVVFAWLVTMLLREPAERVGYAQMSILLPGMLLILLAGAIADRVGLRRQALWSQLFAALTPMLLIYFLYFDALSYSVIIVYALLMGLAQAFVTPARDGLLNHVAGDNIQRMVVLASLCQFGFQILGYTLAGFADTVGAITILTVQSIILLMGCGALLALGEVGAPRAESRQASVMKDLWEGASTVAGNPLMRAVMIQNVAMGIFFMGAFIVALPLVVREIYNGTSGDLAALNAFNSLGLVITIGVLLRLGHIARAGRALLLAQFVGSLVLVLAGWVVQQYLFVFFVFMWGICGGVAMPMSRTLMQQTAPPALRARVMSFYAFSFMGAGPLGALWAGYLADSVGPQNAIIISAGCMALLALIMGVVSPLWGSVTEQTAV